MYCRKDYVLTYFIKEKNNSRPKIIYRKYKNHRTPVVKHIKHPFQISNNYKLHLNFV